MLLPGTKVETPDGPGVVVSIGAGKCMDEDVTGEYLVKIKSDKYWPHWQVYYKKSELTLQ